MHGIGSYTGTEFGKTLDFLDLYPARLGRDLGIGKAAMTNRMHPDKVALKDINEICAYYGRIPLILYGTGGIPILTRGSSTLDCNRLVQYINGALSDENTQNFDLASKVVDMEAEIMRRHLFPKYLLERGKTKVPDFRDPYDAVAEELEAAVLEPLDEVDADYIEGLVNRSRRIVDLATKLRIISEKLS